MKVCNPFGDKCIKFSDNRAFIALRDEKSKSGSEYRAANVGRKNLICLKVDGCLISNQETKKCDFLLLDCDNNIAHFIELKGSDLATAIKQLTNSVKQVMQVLAKLEYEVAFAKLALSRTPKVIPAKEWLDLRRLMQAYKGDALRQNSPYNDVL